MDNQQPGNLSAVPPPPSLTGNTAPVNFNDALSKARAIAEKLKKQSVAATPAPPAAAPSGTKRGYRDDPYDDEYSSRSAYRGDYNDDQRDTKRGMYDRYETSSRPRYGLGSEERKSMSGGYGGDYGNDNVTQDECSVPNHMVGVVIGKGGDNLKKIERMSGAKVQIAPDTGDNERKVHMTGEADQVKIAKDMIQQIVDDTRSNEASRYPATGSRPSYADTMPAASSYGPRSGGTTMTVPSSKVGLIIGRKGETIRDLEERSGAKITIAAETGNERSGERCINIVGEPSAVQKARSLIEEIASDDPHSSTAVTSSRDWSAYRQQHHTGDRGRRDEDSYGAYGSGGGGSSSGGGGHGSYGPPQDRGYGGRGRFNHDEKESIQVPTSAVGFIIGKSGETVRALQDQSGARIKVDPNGDHDSNERTVNIFGNPEAIALAKQLITDKVAEGNANRGGRYGDGGGGRRGGHRSYGNDRYNNNNHHYQQQQQQYQDDGGNSGSGYDYSQYQQYYAQYGYDQYQQQGGGQDAESGQGYQYGGYPYNYEGYGGQYGSSGATDDASKPEKPASDNKDATTTSEKAPEEGASKDAQADYYAQYYGQGGDQQQWSQEQYYQWYQQYYGQYPAQDQEQQRRESDATDTK